MHLIGPMCANNDKGQIRHLLVNAKASSSLLCSSSSIKTPTLVSVGEMKNLDTIDDVNQNPKPSNQNPSKKKPKVVIVMGASGSGKSKLAIDLASRFPIEIINADSMQVYKGLDVLTNKVPIQDQKGVSHHLLGTVNPNVEFTSKDFRDSAIQVVIYGTHAVYFMNIVPNTLEIDMPTAGTDQSLDPQAHTSTQNTRMRGEACGLLIIDDILSRDRLPVIVGGTNYYIQALISPFLLDDAIEDMDDCSLNNSTGDMQPDYKFEMSSGSNISYEHLKELDPDAANRIHPNDHRKVNQYLNLYSRFGVLPSKLFQEKTSEKWGRADKFRYDCCFICVDASLPVLDRYVEQRVDCMMDAGLLYEVYDIYSLSADYTRGLRQAIGVREFEEFVRSYLSNTKDILPVVDEKYDPISDADIPLSTKDKESLREILDLNYSNNIMLNEGIDKLKANTRRLVRRQKRRLNRLQTLFGWDLHYVDATEALLGNRNDSWAIQVVEPAVNIIKSFLYKDESPVSDSEVNNTVLERLNSRDLWTQHVCEACGNRVLRGSHEWEQHKQGRGHRKRMVRLKKSKQFSVDRASAMVLSSDNTQAIHKCSP